MFLYFYKAECLRVVDGDTIDCQIDLGLGIYTHQRLRLLGVNTPELRSSDPAERQLARIAKEFVENSVLGKTLTVQTLKDKTGKYGRYLATIYVGDNLVSLNQMLLDNQLAVVYD